MPANLLILQDNSRSMKRIMNLIGMFDSDSFAGQRVRLYDVENSRPTDLVKELNDVFKAYATSEKSAAVRFIGIDRINQLIAVAANPGIFDQVEQWIKKLDIEVKLPAGAVNNYVYRLHYGRADTIAMAIMALYSGNTFALVQLAQMSQGGGMGGMNGLGMGGMGPGTDGWHGPDHDEWVRRLRRDERLRWRRLRLSWWRLSGRRRVWLWRPADWLAGESYRRSVDSDGPARSRTDRPAAGRARGRR